MSSNITNATNAVPIVVTVSSHGLTTNDWIRISGVYGNTAANGSWQATVIDSNTFSLQGSYGNGIYTSGGKFIPCPAPTSPLVDTVTILETTTTTGTGDIQLNGDAVSPNVNYEDIYEDGDEVQYFVGSATGEYEYGDGIYNFSTNTITRSNVGKTSGSMNSDGSWSKISLSGGSKNVTTTATSVESPVIATVGSRGLLMQYSMFLSTTGRSITYDVVPGVAGATGLARLPVWTMFQYYPPSGNLARSSSYEYYDGGALSIDLNAQSVAPFSGGAAGDAGQNLAGITAGNMYDVFHYQPPMRRNNIFYVAQRFSLVEQPRLFLMKWSSKNSRSPNFSIVQDSIGRLVLNWDSASTMLYEEANQSSNACPSYTYLGTVYCDSNGVVLDTLNRRHFWNKYNRTTYSDTYTVIRGAREGETGYWWRVYPQYSKIEDGDGWKFEFVSGVREGVNEVNCAATVSGWGPVQIYATISKQSEIESGRIPVPRTDLYYNAGQIGFATPREFAIIAQDDMSQPIPSRTFASYNLPAASVDASYDANACGLFQINMMQYNPEPSLSIVYPRRMFGSNQRRNIVRNNDIQLAGNGYFPPALAPSGPASRTVTGSR